MYKFRVLTAFDALIQVVLRATFLFQGSRNPARQTGAPAIGAVTRTRMRSKLKGNVKGEIEVPRTWGVLVQTSSNKPLVPHSILCSNRYSEMKIEDGAGFFCFGAESEGVRWWGLRSPEETSGCS